MASNRLSRREQARAATAARAADHHKRVETERARRGYDPVLAVAFATQKIGYGPVAIGNPLQRDATLAVVSDEFVFDEKNNLVFDDNGEPVKIRVAETIHVQYTETDNRECIVRR